MNEELKKALLKARKALAQAKKVKLNAVVNGVPNAPTTKGIIPESLQKTLRKFGVREPKDLIHINTSDSKYAYLGEEEIVRVRNLKEAVDIAVITAKVLKMQETDGQDCKITKDDIKKLKFYDTDLSFHLKAFGIDSGDEGYEWIPTMVATSYIDEFNLQRKISGLFQEIRMPSNPYQFPVLTNGAIARRVGTVSALTPAQVFKTDKTITFTCVKMTNQYELPEELNEDSAPDVVKVIRQELIEGQEKAIEIAILEGDGVTDPANHQHHFSQLVDVTAGTLITAVTDSPELFWDGLRRKALAGGLLSTVDCGGNLVSETELSDCRAKMGKFGVDPTQLATICSPKGYNQMLNLDDVRTLEQYGAKAPVITGELAKYEGSPVLVSEYLREDCDATGINTAVPANNNKLSIIMVNRKRFFNGLRRAIQVKVEKNRTQYDVLDMVSFARKAFQAVLKSDGSNYAQESSVAIIVNIAS